MKVDILAIAAHPDDIEISAAGTLMKHIDMGKTVAIVDMTQGELGSRGTAETRKEEAAAASQLMGISARVNLEMPDGFFTDDKANKLKLIEQIRHFQPDKVLITAPSDRHPDHGRASKICSDACFLSGLLKIETEWEGAAQEKWRPQSVYCYVQDYYHHPDFVVDISDYVEKKIEVLKCFKTQFHDPSSSEPSTPISGENFFDFLKGRWSEYGRLIGAKYAEGFVAERPVGVEDITTLI
ncbi:MAG: bacillithiol biosynthesis deacetylase BshB1 [Flavobacteriales bacterium]|jgi:bacillithiol biosynthesis deacetylase BshB1|nr:bacillithiol biosynthesis deacetylase BshB1 [Flavobacteriales bacterium]